jgi:lysophospholipase L1-like esterase
MGHHWPGEGEVMLILVEKDSKNRVPKEVTSDQRAAIMAKQRIWDIDASGTVTAGPFGPTSPDPVPVPAVGISNDPLGAAGGLAKRPFNGNIGTRIIAGRMANVIDNTATYTWEATFSLASHADAFRVIFANARTGGQASSTPTMLAKIYAPSSMADVDGATFTQAMNTAGSSTWALAQPTSDSEISFTVTDWSRISTVDRSDGGKNPLISVRAWINGGTRLVMLGNGSDSFDNWSTRPVTERQSRFRRSTTGGDATATFAGSLASACPIVGVQYMARERVYTVMGFGDSNMEGRDSYVGQGFLMRAAEQINAQGLGFKVETANLGFSGASSFAWFLNAARAASAGLHPDVLVYQPASPNDVTSTLTSAVVSTCRQRMSQRLAESFKDSRASVVLMNWAPTNTALKAYGAADSLRTAFNDDIAAVFGSGAISVFDASSVLSGVPDGAGQVQMKAEYNLDGMHYNSAGADALSAALVPKILAAL